MPVFRYQTAAGGASGGGASAVAGVVTAQSGGFKMIEASDRAAALRALVQRGEMPARLEEVQAGALADRVAKPRAGRITRKEMSQFVRDLGTAVNAGLPLVAALKTIARQGRSPAQRFMFDHLLERVEAGDPLSDAMESFGRPFTDLVNSLVRAGESAGRLGETLKHASQLLERDQKLRSQVMGALLYPAIIGSLIVVAIVVVVTFVVPKVLGAVAGVGGVRLPWPTQVVQNLALFFGNWWALILIAGAIGVWAFSRAMATPAFRLGFDRFMLTVPLIGPLLRDVAVARFTRTLGTLVGAGLPVLGGLRITRAVLGNQAMQNAMDDVAEAVAGGSTIAEPLEATGYFPSLLTQIVGLGERTGKLDEMLNQAADAFEDKTEQTVKTVTTILPPMLIVVMACAVGFIVLAILLPLLELQEAASRAM
ncbi:MAG: type II secretion system F family protein [Phycisphaerales bacterium]